MPEETGAKAYALLRRALSEENKVGIAKVSFRDKEHLAALRFKGDVFVLETMYWPDEIREPAFDTLGRDEDVRPNEVAMAKQLIESLTEPWDPTRYRDEYREALLELVEKKLAGEPVEVPEEAPPARIVDLMAALKASVEAAKARAEAPARARRTARGTASKGRTARKATAKTSARKTAASKAATAKKAAAPRRKAVGE
ncbi:Non-homologous end joining protein Ku [bacterium HR12]|nr:Non-homologous end joining protein Ku [bacterium HR12]